MLRQRNWGNSPGSATQRRFGKFSLCPRAVDWKARFIVWSSVVGLFPHPRNENHQCPGDRKRRKTGSLADYRQGDWPRVTINRRFAWPVLMPHAMCLVRENSTKMICTKISTGCPIIRLPSKIVFVVMLAYRIVQELAERWHHLDNTIPGRLG